MLARMWWWHVAEWWILSSGIVCRVERASAAVGNWVWLMGRNEPVWRSLYKLLCVIAIQQPLHAQDLLRPVLALRSDEVQLRGGEGGRGKLSRGAQYVGHAATKTILVAAGPERGRWHWSVHVLVVRIQSRLYSDNNCCDNYP